MRALPIGWVLPHDQAERRRQVTIAMSLAAHADPAALVAACAIAACASWALENAAGPCSWRPPQRKPARPARRPATRPGPFSYAAASGLGASRKRPQQACDPDV